MSLRGTFRGGQKCIRKGGSSVLGIMDRNGKKERLKTLKSHMYKERSIVKKNRGKWKGKR